MKFGSTKGGVKIGNGLAMSGDTLNVTIQSGSASNLFTEPVTLQGGFNSRHVISNVEYSSIMAGVSWFYSPSSTIDAWDSSINAARASINANDATISAGKASINAGKASINAGGASIDAGSASIYADGASIDASEATISGYPRFRLHLCSLLRKSLT